MNNLIEVDGSFGEAGGQIARTAIALSAVTEKPCHIFNIRKGRRDPGLKRQHLSGIKAVAELCDGKLENAKLGSMEIWFYPEKIRAKKLDVKIESAGSTALVLQSLMIPAIHCETALDIKIVGGTINKWAPSIGYMQNVTLPILRKMGYSGEIILHRHGFYPKGNGLAEARIQKSEIKAIQLLKRGKAIHVKGNCIASKDLEKAKVAERMQKAVRERLFKEFQIKPEIKCEYVDSLSTGGGMDLFVLYENSIIGSNSIAERGKSAEKVAKGALDFLMEQHNSLAPIDEHMADQLIPYLALGTINENRESKIKAPNITNHAKTNIWVCEKFLPIKFEIDERDKIISCGTT